MILSVTDFSKRSGFSRRTIQRMLKDGRLKRVERIVKTYGIEWPVDKINKKGLTKPNK